MMNSESPERLGSVGVVLSLNVGRVRDVDRNGRPAKTAIWKTRVAGRVCARGVNLDGDEQADRQAHGGPDKAVYAYSSEDSYWRETDVGRTLEAGSFGENLTTERIDLTAAIIGERWQVGTCLLEVSEPRIPCWRLNLRMDDRRFIQRFAAAGRPGSYLRIIEEGDIGAGDPITIVDVPDHGLTVGDVARIFHHDRDAADRILAVDVLSDAWTSWAHNIIDRQPTTDDPRPGCD